MATSCGGILIVGSDGTLAEDSPGRVARFNVGCIAKTETNSALRHFRRRRACGP